MTWKGIQDNNWVIAVEVEASKDRPHFDGNPYVRKGSETLPASKEIFEDLIASRHEKAGVILDVQR